MQLRLLEWLVCPNCSGNLKANATAHLHGAIEQGMLLCLACDKKYPVINGIPRFVSGDAYSSSFGHQWNKYPRLQLDSENGTNFSYERFFSITAWRPDGLLGKRVLDAGCGSGRFSEIVLKAGAEVVAIDMSTAVDACFANLGTYANLHCVQASIYDLPFKDGTFDYGFSIGVIQHTPRPHDAIAAIVDKVTPGGKVGLWIYELSWKSFVGTVGFKYLLRPITKRLDTATLEVLTSTLESICWPVNRAFRNKGKLGRAMMRLLPVSCAHLQGVPLSTEQFRKWVLLDTFDMYSPTYDQPQRFATVRKWLESAGCDVDRRHVHGGISITATKS